MLTRQPAYGDFFEADYLPIQEPHLASTVFPGAALGGVYGGFGLERAAIAPLVEDVAWDLPQVGLADPFYGGLGLYGDFAYDPLTVPAFSAWGGLGAGLDF